MWGLWTLEKDTEHHSLAWYCPTILFSRWILIKACFWWQPRHFPLSLISTLGSLSVKRSDIKLTSVVWIVAYYARMKLPQDSHNLLNSESFAPSPIRGLGAQSTLQILIPSLQSGSHITSYNPAIKSRTTERRNLILQSISLQQALRCYLSLLADLGALSVTDVKRQGRDGDHHLTKLFCCVCWWLTQSIFVSGQLILFWAAGKVYCYGTVNSVNVSLSHLTFERWPNDCRHQVETFKLLLSSLIRAKWDFILHWTW